MPLLTAVEMPLLTDEINAPGHSASWAAGYPDIVASCPTQLPGTAALDPSSNKTFVVIRALLEEMGKLAPDRCDLRLIFDCFMTDSGSILMHRIVSFTSGGMRCDSHAGTIYIIALIHHYCINTSFMLERIGSSAGLHVAAGLRRTARMPSFEKLEQYYENKLLSIAAEVRFIIDSAPIFSTFTPVLLNVSSFSLHFSGFAWSHARCLSRSLRQQHYPAAKGSV